MPRPKVDDETIEAVNQLCRPHFQLSPEDIGLDKKLRFILERHRDLQEQAHQQQSQPQSGNSPFDDFR